jgi:hypothetical protein
MPFVDTLITIIIFVFFKFSHFSLCIHNLMGFILFLVGLVQR